MVDVLVIFSSLIGVGAICCFSGKRYSAKVEKIGLGLGFLYMALSLMAFMVWGLTR